METMNLTTMTPVEIDTLWAPMMVRRAVVEARIDQAITAIEKIDRGERGYATYRREDYVERQARYEEQREVLWAEEAPLRDEFDRRGGWQRYYLVTNGTGHVHRGTRCSTCFITTQYAWQTDVSGGTDEDVIEAYGHRACTVCFPAAPLHPAWARTTREEEDRVAARNALRCAGSGQQAIDPNYRYYSPRGRCPECRQIIGISKYGKVRTHKPPKGAK